MSKNWLLIPHETTEVCDYNIRFYRLQGTEHWVYKAELTSTRVGFGPTKGEALVALMNKHPEMFV